MATYIPDVHAGGEGTFTANGVDWNVKMWTGKKSTKKVDIATTGDTVTVAGVPMNYGRGKIVQTTFTFQIEAYRDGNNDVVTSIPINGEITNVVLTSFIGHVVTLPKALIGDIDFKQGGVEGASELAFDGQSQGPYTIA